MVIGRTVWSQNSYFGGDGSVIVLCTLFLVSYISSVNVTVFHITWLDFSGQATYLSVSISISRSASIYLHICLPIISLIVPSIRVFKYPTIAVDVSFSSFSVSYFVLCFPSFGAYTFRMSCFLINLSFYY